MRAERHSPACQRHRRRVRRSSSAASRTAPHRGARAPPRGRRAVTPRSACSTRSTRCRRPSGRSRPARSPGRSSSRSCRDAEPRQPRTRRGPPPPLARDRSASWQHRSSGPRSSSTPATSRGRWLSGCAPPWPLCHCSGGSGSSEARAHRLGSCLVAGPPTTPSDASGLDRDLGRFLQMMMRRGQDDVLSAEGIARMMHLTGVASPSYGLGWASVQAARRPVMSSPGRQPRDGRMSDIHSGRYTLPEA